MGDCTICLKSGVHICGKILATDKFTVLMMAQGKQQRIYKTAIPTISRETFFFYRGRETKEKKEDWNQSSLEKE